jgi:hypothetical protein
MKLYTTKEISEIKQNIRKGIPLSIIADDLSKQWDRPLAGIYAKIWKISKMTRKIKTNYNGPKRRAYKPRLKPTMASQLPLEWTLNEKEEIVLKDICEEIIDKDFTSLDETPQQQPAEIGIEVPVSSISFTGTPSRVVIYPDHVRYYYNN